MSREMSLIHVRIMDNHNKIKLTISRPAPTVATERTRITSLTPKSALKGV